MAKSNLKNYTSGDGFGAPLNMRRGNPNPLDNSELFTSFQDAQDYASNSPIAYVGQLITTVVEDTDGNITNTTYRIEDEDGTLNKIATSTDIGEAGSPLPKIENDRYLHTNATTGDLEWTEVSNDAEDVNYDNTVSGLTSTNAQDALDEISESVGDILDDLDKKVDIEQGVEHAGKILKVGNDGNIELATSVEGVEIDDTTTTSDKVWSSQKTNQQITDMMDYEHESIPSVDNVKEALDTIIDKLYYVKPSITSFSCVPSTLQYEIGNTVNSVSFSWALNKDIISQTLTGVTLEPEDRSATYNTPFSSNKTFTLSVSDGENTATSSKAFTFLPKVYCGVDDIQDSYDSAFVVGLGGSLKSGKSGTYNLNIGAGKYGFIAVPTSYGKISVVKIGGFDTEMVDCGTISVTNESGYTQNYYLCRTPQPNLGNISMVVN